MRDQLERLGSNLLGLGLRRLLALGIVGVSVFGAVAFGSYYISRPQFETLYIGLSQQDSSRIGGTLRDAGIAFDISSDGTKIMVPYGETAKARMLLAEKGLPTSASSGYELFDKLGAVGLTSFMQDITRVRALEGEIARSIQTIRGVKAARVHIVMPDLGSFRRARQVPSASVIVATDATGDKAPTAAIQHMVAAAVPSLTPDQVTVMSTDGQLLASGGDSADMAANKLVGLEKTVNEELQENIRRTLVPHLGLNNFEVSVAARLNTDRRQTNETTFDPESRTERSIKSVKENSRSENSGSRSATTVEQNVPGEGGGGAGESGKSQNDRKEDLTNYELSSKVVSTSSNGYKVENLTVAVVVNRKQILSALGANPTQEAIDRQIQELQRIVETAAGADTKRGDRVTVSALDFTEGAAFPPLPEPGIVDVLMRQAGSFVNAAAIIIATFLLVWFGLRPAIQGILDQGPPQITAEATAAMGAGTPLSLEGTVLEGRLPGPDGRQPQIAGEKQIPEISISPSPQQRLDQVVDKFEEQAAAILKQWMKSK